MSRQKIKGCARHSFRDYEMKKFIISAVMALLIGGFAFTANAQNKTKDAKPKVAAQVNKQNAQTNEYQKMVDEFVAAVNEFSTAYKSSLDAKNGKSFTPDQMEKLMKKAESKYNDVNKYYEKLSKSQKQAVDYAKKLFDQTKNAFLTK
jgi:methyl-accepting chemotaxis protein